MNRGTQAPHQSPTTYPPFDVPALRYIADRGCTYLNDGQPPACPKEWEGEPWKWCGACLAANIAKEVADV